MAAITIKKDVSVDTSICFVLKIYLAITKNKK